MASMLSKPKVDTAGQARQAQLLQEQEKRIQQQEQDTKKREASSLRARRAAGAKASLLTGGETGVTDARQTLG